MAELAAPSTVGPHARAAADAVSEGTRGRRSRRRTPKIQPPDDFEDEQTFLQHVRRLYAEDLAADQQNRDESTADARFVAGDQWDSAVKQRRHASAKPTLTINRLPAYVAQIVGNRRLSETGIKIIPDTGGTKKVAGVREGLIRSIQKFSRAQYAFDKAFESQVIGGLGNFQIHLDYAHDDVFEQDIRIAAIPNPLAVVWDASSVDPSGADAEHVFVVDQLPREEFKRRYPDVEGGDWNAELRQNTAGWDSPSSVQVVSFWRMRSRTREVALMKDGSVQDVTDLDDEHFALALEAMAVNPETGEPMMREVQRKYAQMYLCTANQLLAGPYDLPIQRLPVFRVPGWELFIEGERFRWGLVRFLRDPQRLFNYWRSTVAEKLVGSPKAKWVAASSAVEGREESWRKSHLTEDPLLIYNAESGAPPTRVGPVEMEAALIQEAGMAAQDIRDVSNLHEANMGETSNEVSGRAIMARQRVGEVGSVIYQDNLNTAIEECGKVINDLIPFVYDTARMIKVLGPDMITEEHVRINDPTAPESVDLTAGKYSVTVTTGPSYTTRRVESREEMMAMVNAMPETMAVAADKIVEAQDWPGADEIARRLRTQLPPGMVAASDLDEREQALLQQQSAAQQEQQALQMQIAQLEMQGKQAETDAKRAEALLKEAQARKALADAEESEARAHLAIAQARKALAEIGQEERRLEIEERTPTPAVNGAR